VNLAANSAYYLEVAAKGSSAGGHLVANISYSGSVNPTGVVVPTASKLGFNSAPSGGTTGSALPVQPVVAVQAADGSTITSDSSTLVSLAVASGPGTLSCTGGQGKIVVAGVAAFNGCVLSAPGTYTLRATATGLTQATSGTFTITTPVVGTRPLGPNYVAATTGTASATITWADVEGESGYNIIRYTGSGWTQVGSVGANVTSFTEQSLAPATYYAYWVIAFNAAGSTYAPTYLTAITTSTIPAPPASTSATGLSDTQIRLTWEDNSDNEDGFKVLRYSAGSWVEVGSTGPNTSGFTDSGLTSGQTYAYWITAYNAAGMAYGSAYISAVAKGPSGDAPSYSDPVVTADSARITWTNNGTAATGWRVIRFNGSTWAEVGTLPADATSFSESGLTPGTYYAYWLIKDTASGSNYAATYITVIPTPMAPAKPAFTSAWGGSGQATVTWADNSNNEDGFKVLRYVSGAWVPVADLGPNITRFTDTGLSKGVTYAYWITAYNSSGTSYGGALISAAVF
jgi:titin